MKKEEIEKFFYPKRLSKYNYNFFIPRTSVLRFLQEQKGVIKGSVVDLACGHMPYRELILSSSAVTEYTPMDIASEEIYKNNNKVIIWDGKRIPLESESVDTIVLTEFLEHVQTPGAISVEMYRVLRPGGCIIGTVPFIWPMHETPHDQYRYTPYSLKSILESAGFGELKIEGLGGKNAVLILSLAFWMQHKSGVLKVLRPFFLAWMRRLYKTDHIGSVWEEGAVFSGLGFVAYKK